MTVAFFLGTLLMVLGLRFPAAAYQVAGVLDPKYRETIMREDGRRYRLWIIPYLLVGLVFMVGGTIQSLTD